MATFGEITIFLAVIAVGVYFLRKYAKGGWHYGTERIDGKVVIVTGSNTGIGRETALDMVKRGGQVVLACRSTDKANEAAKYIRTESGEDSSRVTVMKLDLSSLTSVRSFAEEFKKKYKQLDLLIHNAGVMMCPYQKTADGFEMQIGTNHFGPFLLTELLIDYLKASAPSRIVVVSSLAHSFGTINFDDINSTKSYSAMGAYGQSKLANVLFARELAQRLKGTGVTAYSLHPGSVDTELQRHTAWLQWIKPFTVWLLWKNATEGAQTTITCALDEKLANEEASGKYYSDCTEKTPSKEGQDDDVARRLWVLSEQMVGLKKDK